MGEIKRTDLHGDLQLGFDSIGDLSTMTTTEKTNLTGAISEVKNEVTSHKAENVSKVVLITEPAGQITDTTVNLGFKPKNIQIQATIDLGQHQSVGFTDGITQIVRYYEPVNSRWVTSTTAIYIRDSASNYIYGVIVITDTGFKITWTKVGTLFDDKTRKILISATTH